MHSLIDRTKESIQNIVAGAPRPASGARFAVVSPYTGKTIGDGQYSTSDDLNVAVEAAAKAQLAWAKTPIKERAQVLFRFREELLKDIDSISIVIASESGKLPSEGKAGLLKGIEVLEYAISLQNLDEAAKLMVSTGVSCEFRREGLGVVAGITPFNFPAMVPMWMIPIAIGVGNSFIWKPSDKTPLTPRLVADCFKRAGLPAGVFSVVHGDKSTVEAICAHPEIKAVGFVGSSAVAKTVYEHATKSGKRALCLGGAKNPIILMPDADPEVTVPGVVASFTGCAGQRCMAASLLIAVGEVDSIIDRVIEQAKKLRLGIDMGAIISKESLSRLEGAIARAEKEGARIRLDGRKPTAPQGFEDGNWLAPTILDGVRIGSEAACDELFGPVLSIVRVKSLSEALAIDAANRYGNACSVFTRSGAVAEEVASRSRAGMIGVNIGVPVPREPFSFGGFNESRYGHGDITGMDGVQFWSNLKKVTVKWSLQKDQTWMG